MKTWIWLALGGAAVYLATRRPAGAQSWVDSLSQPLEQNPIWYGSGSGSGMIQGWHR